MVKLTVFVNRVVDEWMEGCFAGWEGAIDEEEGLWRLKGKMGVEWWAKVRNFLRCR